MQFLLPGFICAAMGAVAVWFAAIPAAIANHEEFVVKQIAPCQHTDNNVTTIQLAYVGKKIVVDCRLNRF